MADQEIENIVDRIEEILLYDLDITSHVDHDERSIAPLVWYDTQVNPKQRDKLVKILEELFRCQ